MWWYPSTDDPDFYAKLQNKQEFGSLLTSSTRKGELAPHQLFVSRFLSPKTPYDSLLLFHALGSGKTCSAISIAENFPKVLVLVKNQTIATNFKQELFSEFCTQDKYLNPTERRLLASASAESRKDILQNAEQRFKRRYEFMTFGVLVNRVLGTTQPGKTAKESLDPDLDKETKERRVTNKLGNLSNRLVIIDEFHNIVGNEVYNALTLVLAKSYNTKILLLSATPIFDNLSELPGVMNLLLPQKYHLPLDYKSNGLVKRVNTGEVQEGEVYRLTPLGRETVARLLQGRVSYIGTDLRTFPRRIDMGIPLVPTRKYSIFVVPCPMSEYQAGIYSSVAKKEHTSDTPQGSVAWKNSSDAATMVYPGNLYGIKGFQKVSVSSTRAASSLLPGRSRQSTLKKEYTTVFGTDLRQYSSKLFQLVNNIKNIPGNCFVYSQFVSGSGLAAVRFALDQNGFQGQYQVIDGSVSESTRKRILRSFNSPTNINGQKIRILLGSPAISEGITLKNVRQIHIIEPPWNMSRLEQVIGRGIRSNSHSALPEDQRNVRIFRYVATIPNKETVDEYKYRICEEKDRAIKEFERILKQIAIDCKYATANNDSSDNFSPKCDYTLCDYSCPPGTNRREGQPFDTGTMFSHVSGPDVTKNIQELKRLFALQPYYSLEELVKATTAPTVVVYKALHKLIQSKDYFVNTKGQKGYIIYRNGYYFFNPLGVPARSSLHSKTNTDSRLVTTSSNPDALPALLSKLDEKLGSGLRRQQPAAAAAQPDQHRTAVLFQNEPIYGTLEADNKFRIVDNRNTLGRETNDKRRQKRGSVCNSSGFTLKDLEGIFAFITGSPPGKMTKTQLCNAIQTALEAQNKVIRL